MLSVATNLLAINTSRQLRVTETSLNRSSMRLSSGLRINSAADDAAGLAISEKMRAQVRGLRKADGNIRDGINLIQTADGGMNEISDMLIRQRELIIQGLNDTNTDDDRAKIQTELKQLTSEIGSISDRVEFNTIKLLNKSDMIPTGMFEATPSVIDLSKVTSVTFFERSGSVYEVTIPIEDLINGSSVHWIPPGYLENPRPQLEEYVFSVDPANNTVTSLALSGNDRVALNNIMGVRLNGLSEYDVTEAWASNIVFCTPGGSNINNSLGPVDTGLSFPDYTANYDVTITWNFMARREIMTNDISNRLLWIQSGANEMQGMYIDLYDCRPGTLGIQNLSLSSTAAGNNSLRAVDAAIDKVTDYRATCGAQQNRLEHAMNAANTSADNTEDAMSRISDADMAKEVMARTRATLLMQAGMSMLTQARQQPEMVLQLLRS